MKADGKFRSRLVMTIGKCRREFLGVEELPKRIVGQWLHRMQQWGPSWSEPLLERKLVQIPRVALLQTGYWNILEFLPTQIRILRHIFDGSNRFRETFGTKHTRLAVNKKFMKIHEQHRVKEKFTES